MFWMKSWRDELKELLGGLPSETSAGSRETLIAAVEEFAEELRKNGLIAVVGIMDDAIDLKVFWGSGLEMDLLVKGESQFSLSLFSPRAVVSDFSVGSLSGVSKEQIIRALLFVYRCTILSRRPVRTPVEP
jgi:hypothetical protein